MSGHAKNVESFTLKDGDRDYTALIYFQEGTKPLDFTQETLKHYVSHAINGLGEIHSNLPNGSRLILAVMPSKNLQEEKTPSASARKKKKSKSQRTGKRRRPTSSVAG